MKKYYFRAEKMSVGYHKLPLIENIDIGLEKGEILTLIGPNGAGKSTVLKSIAKQLALIGGTVYLDEKNTEIIILDEPTSYLDVKYKLEFLSILQKMRKKKGSDGNYVTS